MKGRLARVEELFHAAAAMVPEQRTQFLERACADDPTVLGEVMELLNQHVGGTRGVLAQLPGGTDRVAESDPEQVGQYRVLKLLGEGGMGRVYEAEQASPRRRVALKLMVSRAGARELHQRFVRESQFLAALKHEGIAQVFEAGSATDERGVRHDYMAMELVEGLSLTAHARSAGLSVRERVGLAARVCDAVQHAHERGVIHRDLKPANILVERGEGPGRPKVLDFGIARPAGAEMTGVTEAGRILGTLAYMSPEQLGGETGTIDTRSDVYALGVILYELLAGVAPHAVEGRSLAEAARMIRDEEPVRLGAKDRTLRGDLETIVARAMAKDRLRRYASAAELGAELRRFLQGDPIEARRDSYWYVTRRQVAKHRAVSAAVGALVVLVVGSSVLFGVMAERNALLARSNGALAEERQSALEQAQQQRRRADEQLLLSDVERGKLLTLTGNTGAAGEVLWGALLSQPGSEEASWALQQWLARRPVSKISDLGFVPFSVAASRDGRWLGVGEHLLTGRSPEEIRAGTRVALVDGATLEVRARFDGFQQTVSDLDFSPSGRFLAAVDGEDQVRLFELSENPGELRCPVRGPAWQVRFHDDEEMLVACEGGWVRMVHVPDGVERWAVRVCSGCEDWRGLLWDLALSERAGLFAACTRGGKLSARRISDGGVVWTRSSPEDRTVRAIAFSPSGEELVSLDAAGEVCFADARSGEVKRRLSIAPSARCGVRYADERTVVADTTSVLEIDASSATIRGSIVEDEGETFRTVRLGESDSMAMIGRSRSVDLADARSERGVTRTRLPLQSGAGMRLCPGERVLLVWGVDAFESWVYALEFPGLRVLKSKAFPLFTRFAFVGTRPVVVAVVAGQQPRVLDVRAMAEVARFASLGEDVYQVSFDQEGRRAFGNVRDGDLVSWDLGSGELVAKAEGKGKGLIELVPLPDGIMARSAGDLTPLDGATLGPWRANSAGAGAAGGALLAPRTNGRIRVIDLPGLSVRCEFAGNNVAVTASAISADGTLAVSGSEDRKLRLWSARTGRELAILARLPGRARALQFSRDGRFVVALAEEGTVVQFDLDAYAGHFAAQARVQASRAQDSGQAAALQKLATEVESRAAARREPGLAGEGAVLPRDVEGWTETP